MNNALHTFIAFYWFRIERISLKINQLSEKYDLKNKVFFHKYVVTDLKLFLGEYDIQIMNL